MTTTNKKRSPVPFDPSRHEQGIVACPDGSQLRAVIRDLGKLKLRRLKSDPNLAEWTVRE